MTTQSYRTDSQSQVPAVVILQGNADGTSSLFAGSLGGGAVGAAGVNGAAAQSVQGVTNGIAVPTVPIVPAAGSTAGVASGLASAASAVAAGSLILKASGGLFFGGYASSTVAGWLMVFNSATVPADGTVTPLHAVPVPANGIGIIPSGNFPEWLAAGVTLVFSSTGPFIKTLSATAFIHGAAK